MGINDLDVCTDEHLHTNSSEIDLNNLAELKVYNECDRKGRVFKRRFPLPRFDSTLPFARNHFDLTHQNEIREWTDWLYQFSQLPIEIYKGFEGVVIFSAYFYPFCSQLKRYEMLTLNMIAFFIFDDHCDNDPNDVAGRVSHSHHVWQQFGLAFDKVTSEQFIPMTDWKPYIIAMYALNEQICSAFNDCQKRRFVYMWKEYMRGNIEETIAMQEKRKFKTLEEMIDIRVNSVGAKPVVQLCEYSEDFFVPEDDWNDPDLQELFKRAAMHVVFVNDLYSFEKEYKNQNENLESMFNLIALRVIIDGCSIQEAMIKQVEMIVNLETDTQQLVNKLLAKECSEGKNMIISRATYVMGGNWKGSTIVDRYNKFEVNV